MNDALSRAAEAAGLSDPAQRSLRLAFGLACVSRVEHLLEDARAKEALRVLQAWVEGRADDASLQTAATDMQAVAGGHRGSDSIDGSAHAAVSATYAVANALAGRALEAADYAAYASVYAYGGYAVNDRASFEPEFVWQVQELERLAGKG
ncbi:putative immunity protein [Ramlibacter sp. PS3R-8]|uniref:putative immunity protein n=1 Tax=Ramlibacter sp. PS3R-8 TaxID=3133437 RepID=UPI0030B4FAF3